LAEEPEHSWVKQLVEDVDEKWHDNMFELDERAYTMHYINADI